MLIILVLVLVNDGIYYLRNFSEAELAQREEAAYITITENPAILIVSGEHSAAISEKIGNLYFVEEVKLQDKQALVDALCDQYQLDEARMLLDDLNLPAVLEIYFSAYRFGTIESDLFLQAAEGETGIYQMIYTEENYVSAWQSLTRILQIQGKMETYLPRLYIALGILVLVITGYFRISYETRNLKYWKVYIRSGGHLRQKRLVQIMNSLLLVLLPLVAVLGMEYYLFYGGYLDYSPDFWFHIIRAAALTTVSVTSLLTLRRISYA